MAQCDGQTTQLKYIAPNILTEVVSEILITPESVVETREVLAGVKACADIITMHLGTQAYCQLKSWGDLIDTWMNKGQQMRIREFQEHGEDGDCVAFRSAAIRQARKAEQYGVVEQARLLALHELQE
jgi:hypothetical protein